MCPVPIRLVRVKTGVHYTTFLDRDAIMHLKEYLAWKVNKHGRQDSKKPLFVTNMDNPINSNWISKNFSNMAIRAGIQTKVSRRVYRIRAHDVRDLLKSTLMAAGCKQYAMLTCTHSYAVTIFAPNVFQADALPLFCGSKPSST